jgi:hypothetical protein
MNLSEQFEKVCLEISDINEHCRKLYELALECQHVTEFGVRAGNSTTAFLAAKPATLVCYDINPCPVIETLKIFASETELVFHQESTLDCEIQKTDLLFIDTLHDSDQIEKELAKHGNKSGKYLVFHDTETFGVHGETKGREGIRKPIADFVTRNDHWEIHQIFTNNNGLTILKRR